MKQTFILITLIAGLFACQPKKTRLNYPMTKKVDTVDIYFGQQVPDPYRWLEDDRSDETAEWVKAQNEVTFAYLEKIPFRQQLRDRLTKIWNYLKISAPWHQSGHYFMFKNDGLQNQSVLYVKESLEGTERILLDPNTLSDDGTVALANLDISDDGKYLAYGIARGGSDWNEFYVKNIETNEQLSDQILWTKFSGISWFNDGFFYSRFPKPDESNVLKGMNENCKIYYHKIGTIQEEDKLIYEDTKHPQWTFYAGVTDDKKILIISVSESTSGNALYVKNLETNGPIIKLVETFNNDYGVVDHQDGKLLVQTNYKAPKYKLISIDLKNPASENWKDIIPEKEGVLSGVSVFKNKWMVQYSKDAHDLVELYNADGTYAQPLELPEICTVGGFNGEKEDSFTFYTITSFTTPSTVYKYDIETNKSELYLTSPVDFDGTKYETKQVFYTSKDGTKVPMFIVHKKDMKLDGKNPVLLYGYGGFNITYTPAFSLFRIMWLEQGGVFALAGLRGGGEYGEDWHKTGTLMQKQNVFDDCIAAAEYLINEKYTSAGKVALQGGSNGGLLVGAVINQRPDLYGVALPAVGVMDMLRYHKFTIGFHWATDYGTSEDSIEMFKYLLGYSPLHTIKENIEYPAVFVTTGDHDDRVVPAHSFKYAATLQEKYKGTNPVLIRIETNAGHGAGKPTAKIIDEYTDELAFAFYNLGMKPKFEDTAEKK